MSPSPTPELPSLATGQRLRDEGAAVTGGPRPQDQYIVEAAGPALHYGCCADFLLRRHPGWPRSIVGPKSFRHLGTKPTHFHGKPRSRVECRGCRPGELYRIRLTVPAVVPQAFEICGGRGMVVLGGAALINAPTHDVLPDVQTQVRANRG